jgi:hypothetical protein
MLLSLPLRKHEAPGKLLSHVLRVRLRFFLRHRLKQVAVGGYIGEDFALRIMDGAVEARINA